MMSFPHLGLQSSVDTPSERDLVSSVVLATPTEQRVPIRRVSLR